MAKRENQRMLKRVNATVVTKEDLWELAGDSEKYHKDTPEVHGWQVGMMLIARRHRRKPEKAYAIWCRLGALARLVEDEGAPGWTLPKLPDGAILTEAAVFAAAAVHPLVERDGDFVFERESFLARVLDLAEPEGRG